MPHERQRLAAVEEEARHRHLIERERAGRAASLQCSLAELDALDAAVARATGGWSRARRVAFALAVQKEARQAGHTSGRAAYTFLLDRYQRLGQTLPGSEPGRPEPSPKRSRLRSLPRVRRHRRIRPVSAARRGWKRRYRLARRLAGTDPRAGRSSPKRPFLRKRPEK